MRGARRSEFRAKAVIFRSLAIKSKVFRSNLLNRMERQHFACATPESEISDSFPPPFPSPYAFQTLPSGTLMAAIALRVSTMHCAQWASSL
jgi:hypothetical protein